MGSLIPSSQNFMPELYSYNNYQNTCDEINLISKQLCQTMKVDLIICSDTLKFNYKNWKLSAVKAKIGVFPEKEKMLVEGEEQGQGEAQYSYVQTFDLTLSMRQVYKVFNLLKPFKKDHKQTQVQTSTSHSMQTPNIASAELYELQAEDKICDICYNEEIDMALPCGHVFGAQCISTYIIEKEQKKCPKCRFQFQGGRDTVKKNFYTIIDDEQKSIYEELRKTLLYTVSSGNEKAIKAAERCLEGLRQQV